MNEETPMPSHMPEEMPLELELDLLVDEELPEPRRRELLRSLDKMPAHWRDLSIRFLERQVEKKSARQLIASGVVARREVAPEKNNAAPNYKFPGRWLTPMRLAAVAAGFLIAITSALVTSYLLKPAGETKGPDVTVASNTVNTRLPGSLVGTEIPVQVSVVNLERNSGAVAFFPRGSNDGPGSRRSVVIKPDGFDNALVIPVKNLQIQ